jgi:hypothetical protein
MAILLYISKINVQYFYNYVFTITVLILSLFSVSHSSRYIVSFICISLNVNDVDHVSYVYYLYIFLFYSVLGLELRPYTLSHSISPFFVIGVFEIGSLELFAKLSSNLDLCFLSQ